MAANMIGVNKRIIAFDNEGTYMVMFNPQIVKQSGGYEAEEGCLSLTGTRKTRRWQSIKVQYQNEKFQTRLKTFTGWTAQIIQHEIDHCEGIGKRGTHPSHPLHTKRHTRWVCLSAVRNAQAAAYRSTPIKFPEKVRLCRTFSPLPVLRCTVSSAVQTRGGYPRKFLRNFRGI